MPIKPTPSDSKEITPVTVSQGKIYVQAVANGKDSKAKAQLKDSNINVAIEQQVN